MSLAAIAVGKIALPKEKMTEPIETTVRFWERVRDVPKAPTTVYESRGCLEWNKDGSVSFKEAVDGRIVIRTHRKVESVIGIDPFNKRYKK